VEAQPLPHRTDRCDHADRHHQQRWSYRRAGPPLASSFGVDSVTRPSSTILASAA
jgi:hypothetical protein